MNTYSKLRNCVAFVVLHKEVRPLEEISPFNVRCQRRWFNTLAINYPISSPPFSLNMTKLRLSLTIANAPRARHLLNCLTLMANGPTDYEDCWRRLDREHVWNWVRHNCVEGAKKEYKAEADVKWSEGVENWANTLEPLMCNFGGASVDNIERS